MYLMLFFQVSNAWYWHQNFKLVTGVRAGLVSIVYNKTTMLSISAVNKNIAVTLMSADVERKVNGLRTIHDIWANFIQIAIAAWLLEKQVGVAIVASLVVAAVCGYITLKVGDAAGTSQGVWMESIEKRIGR
jgi:ATP-binding cassette subfamily C (CFTR/MRP) protein 1